MDRSFRFFQDPPILQESVAIYTKYMTSTFAPLLISFPATQNSLAYFSLAIQDSLSLASTLKLTRLKPGECFKGTRKVHSLSKWEVKFEL